jgi:hypothetical protein
MSLVQSFINQIGREIGRDVYNSVKSNVNVKSNYGGGTSTFLEQLNGFKLSAYDKLTMNNLVNLVESVSKISPNNFNNLEYFIEVDEKIDFCKEHLDKKYEDQLEKLDSTNQKNFQEFLLLHKIYIAQVHEDLENKINSYKEPNKWLMRLTNFWPYLWVLIMIWMTTNYDSLHHINGRLVPGNWMFWAIEVFVLFVCLFPSITKREGKIENIILDYKNNCESIKALETYFQKIIQIKF